MSSDQSETTFFDRLKIYLHVTDPRTLIYSDERILEAKKQLDTNSSSLTFDEKRFNEKLVSAAIHPVTGEVIPKIFRVSAIAPVNIPLVWAMLTCPATNVPGTLFLHWLNQSYNTACNYANRSGSDQSMEALMKAYGLAVTSACTIAYGLGKLVARGPKVLQRYTVIIPCVATAAANISNIAFTRMDEITNGVPVFDETGKVSELTPNSLLSDVNFVSEDFRSFLDCRTNSSYTICSNPLCISTCFVSFDSTGCNERLGQVAIIAWEYST